MSQVNNRLDVPALLKGDMKAVLDFQLSQPTEENDGSFAAMREAYIKERRFWNEGGPEMLRKEDVSVATRHGAVTARIYQAVEKPVSTLYFIHGGGFLVGNNDTHDRIMRILAEKTGATVIGVDYTLSPEARHPQPIEEVADVVAYFHAHQAEHGIDASKISFAGDSAGAYLSMASVLWIRDKAVACGEIVSVLLYYGLFGLRDGRSRQLYGGTWDWLRPEDLKSYEDAYLADASQIEDPYYCLFNCDLKKAVPPAFVISAEYDPLSDDSVALAQLLKAYGHEVHFEEYPGVLHAFLHFSRMMPEAMKALEEGAAFLKAHL